MNIKKPVVFFGSVWISPGLAFFYAPHSNVKKGYLYTKGMTTKRKKGIIVKLCMSAHSGPFFLSHEAKRMDLNLEITVPYQKAFFSDLRKKILIQRGGTRSSKTHSSLQMLMNWLFTGDIRHGQRIPKGVATVVRKVGTSLKGSVIRDMENMMKGKGIYRLIKHHKTDRTFTYKDRMIEFIGADDEHKLRGPSRQILFCNEGDSLQYKAEFFQLLVRTTDLVIIDFNPSDPYTWINLELEQKRARQKKDVEVIVSTYKDNPTLTKGQIQEIEYLEEVDEDLWLVYGLGQYGNVKGLIYPKAEIIEEIPYDKIEVSGLGMDLGFGSSPSTLIDCGANRFKENLPG